MLKTAAPIFISILSALVVSAYADSLRQRSLAGALFKSFFYSYIPEYDADNIKTEHLSEELRQRVEEYKRRYRKLRVHRSACGRLTGIKLSSCNKERSVESAILSLIDKQGIEKLAASYARRAVLFYEWEGYADGPLDEAKYAEEYLKKRLATPLKPYLLLFLAHRYRCAYECLEYEEKFEQQKLAASKYQYYLQQAKEQRDPLVGLIAEDMDAEPYLYIKTKRHP